MTVNVVLLTADSIVFGCDSVASEMTHLVDPFGRGAKFLPSKKGSKNFRIEFTPSSLQRYVTNTWDGVTKLFQIHEGNTPVAAITAGLAKLNGKTMEQIAHEFAQAASERSRKLVRVQSVANAFKTHLRKEFDKHYKDSNVGEEYRDGPEFLVGGYGRDDEFPSLYKIKVKENEVLEHYSPSSTDTGVAWNGQANAVQRFLLGYDGSTMYAVNRQHQAGIVKAHGEMSKKMSKIINDIVDKTGISLPEDLEIDLALPKSELIDLAELRTNISYDSIPLQSAVDFVSHLVNLQSAAARFESGIPTVGGRVLIGILTKKKNCLEILGKPEVVHDHTGEYR